MIRDGSIVRFAGTVSASGATHGDQGKVLIADESMGAAHVSWIEGSAAGMVDLLDFDDVFDGGDSATPSSTLEDSLEYGDDSEEVAAADSGDFEREAEAVLGFARDRAAERHQDVRVASMETVTLLQRAMALAEED